jgi:hypothetical protein
MVNTKNNFTMSSYAKVFPELYAKKIIGCFHVHPDDKAVALARVLY